MYPSGLRVNSLLIQNLRGIAVAIVEAGVVALV